MDANKQAAAPLIDCDRCAALVSDYVRRELDGEPVQRQMADVSFHIETCPNCEELYFREFRRQGELRSSEQLRQVPLWPGVAAAIEQITVDAMLHTWNERMLAYGRAWFDRASGQLRQFEVLLADLLQPPPPALELALAGLQGEPAKDSGGILQLSAEDDGFDLAVRTLPDRGGLPAFCQLEVVIALYDALGDFAGAEVTLVAGAVKTAVSDELVAWFLRTCRSPICLLCAF